MTTNNVPPKQLWLSYTPGQYVMQRTEHGDPAAVRYVLGTDYDELLEYVERMTSRSASDPVSVLNDLRFALGDNGKRSIPELIEYARELASQPAMPADAAMAAEYQRWIDAHHQGMDYDDFLKGDARRRIEGE